MVFTFAILYSTINLCETKDITEVWSQNANGETYGKDDYYSSESPDLVHVVNSSGIAGYVRKTDLDDKITSIDDALVYMDSGEYANNRTIPLYKSDGKTIIGDFEISGTMYKIIDR